VYGTLNTDVETRISQGVKNQWYENGMRMRQFYKIRLQHEYIARAWGYFKMRKDMVCGMNGIRCLVTWSLGHAAFEPPYI